MELLIGHVGECDAWAELVTVNAEATKALAAPRTES